MENKNDLDVVLLMYSCLGFANFDYKCAKNSIGKGLPK